MFLLKSEVDDMQSNSSLATLNSLDKNEDEEGEDDEERDEELDGDKLLDREDDG
jgi:hypothetical protein